jgi:hypothetical protein
MKAKTDWVPGPGIRIITSELHGSGWIVSGTTSAMSGCCPICGSASTSCHGATTRLLQDLPAGVRLSKTIARFAATRQRRRAPCVITSIHSFEALVGGLIRAFLKPSPGCLSKIDMSSIPIKSDIQMENQRGSNSQRLPKKRRTARSSSVRPSASVNAIPRGTPRRCRDQISKGMVALAKKRESSSAAERWKTTA